MRFCLFRYGCWAALSKAFGTIAVIFALTSGASAEDRPVLVAFGDSLTQGYGLPEEQGFVPQLERWLENQAGDVRVVNAGVSGDTTAGGAARIEWTLTPDVDAIMVTLGGNDLLRGLEPELTRANLERVIEAAQRAGVDVLLVGMTAPGNFGAGYKEAFDRIYPELAAKYNVGFVKSFFLGLSENGAIPSPAEVQRFMQADGIHPNADGVRRIVEGIGPEVAQFLQLK